MPKTFIIQKLIIELELNSEDEYQKIANYIETNIYDFLLRELEQTFSHYFAEIEEHLIIEKLELELPSLPVEVLQSEQLVAEIKSSLRHQLKAATSSDPLIELRKSESKANRRLGIDHQKQLERKAGTELEPRPERGGSFLRSYQASKQQSLQHYLLTGQFVFGLELSQAEFLDSFDLETERNSLIQWIVSLSVTAQQYQVLKRLALQLPSTQKEVFFAEEGIINLNKVFQVPLHPIELKEHPSTPSETDQQSQPSSKLPENIQTVETSSEAKKETSTAASSTSHGMTQEQSLRSSTDGWYVNNAGIVILAPYLPALFQKAGLLNQANTAFRHESSIFYAIHLIEYLANKSTIKMENTAILNKLLCGLPLDAPMATQIAIKDASKDLATRLLLQVAKKWDIKIGDQIDLLRGSFFIRNGKLTHLDNHWLLTVETKAYDSHLFKKLPWSFKRIKLPWMSKWLQVDWY